MLLVVLNTTVFLGMWGSTLVAAKKLKGVAQEKEFREELNLLRYIYYLSDH